MSAWTNGTYTRKGIALLAKLTQGSSLRITRAVSGTGYVKPETLADQTTVIGVKQELAFMAASYPEAGTCKLPVFLTNNGLAAGYKAKQIGLYANDPDEGEILYFVAQSQTGTDVPGAAEMPDYSATWTFYFHYGQADDVTVNVDPSHTVTPDMLAEVRAIAEAGISNGKEGVIIRNEKAAALPFAGLKLFGKTTQDGTPSPNNPVKFVSVGGNNITVHINTENLFDANSINVGTNTSVNVSGDEYTLTVSGGTLAEWCSSSYFLPESLVKALRGKTVYLACDSFTKTQDVAVRMGLNITKENGEIDYPDSLSPTVFSRKIKIAESATKIQVSIYANNTGKVLGVDNTLVIEGLRITLASGAKWDKYAGQSLTVSRTLPGVPVASGGNYTDEKGQQWVCDEVDFARGVYVKRVHSETVILTYDAPYNRYTGQLSNFAASRYVVGVGIPVLSTDFTFNPNASSTSYGIRISSSGTKMLIACHDGKHSVTSTTVVYPIETPEETPLTAEELAAYAALTANNPVTTVVNDAGAWMEVDLVEAQHEKALKMLLAQVQRMLNA